MTTEQELRCWCLRQLQPQAGTPRSLTRHFPVSGSQAALWLLQVQGTQGASSSRDSLPPPSGGFCLRNPGAQSCRIQRGSTLSPRLKPGGPHIHSSQEDRRVAAGIPRGHQQSPTPRSQGHDSLGHCSMLPTLLGAPVVQTTGNGKRWPRTGEPERSAPRARCKWGSSCGKRPGIWPGNSTSGCTSGKWECRHLNRLTHNSPTRKPAHPHRSRQTK